MDEETPLAQSVSAGYLPSYEPVSIGSTEKYSRTCEFEYNIKLTYYIGPRDVTEVWLMSIYFFESRTQFLDQRLVTLFIYFHLIANIIGLNLNALVRHLTYN